MTPRSPPPLTLRLHFVIAPLIGAYAACLPGRQFRQTWRQRRFGYEMRVAANAALSQSPMALTSTALFSRLSISWPSSSYTSRSALRPSARNASYICCDSAGGTLVSLRPWTNSRGAVIASALNSGDNRSRRSRSLTGCPYLGWAAAAIHGSVLRYQVF